MMRRNWILALIALTLACPSAQPLEAGAAKQEITAPIGTPLNGYGDRLGRNSVAVHDPLWSRALFLDDGATRILLVSVDLCVINPELRDRVLALAPAEVPPENIILAATHTHSGQGAMIKSLVVRSVSGRFIPEVLESTAQGIAQSMRAAFENRRRAAFGYGVAKQQSLTVNRRYPDGPIDEQIGVIRVEDADGNAIAIVANLAAHPTSVGGADKYSFSADYPGFYYSELENLSSPGCIAMFLNGAEGNQTIGRPEGTEGWARTEAVGRLLAGRVKELANQITCGDAKLHVACARPALPRTLAEFQPESVLLQTLEINNLLLAFFPGEPCVELGLELRRQALERGYQAQFSVGLANDYLMYFIPRKFYAHFNYESCMNFFGPAIEDWFYREFGKLMTRGTPAPDPAPIAPVDVEQAGGGLRVALAGSPRTMGFQRGQAFAEDIRTRYQRRIVEAVRSGALRPKSGFWASWPDFLDPTPLALPAMGMAARPLLEGVSPALIEELEGMADGAALPFDAMWLLQNAAWFTALEDKQSLFQTPLCTMFAALGDRAGADDLLVARNLDWADEELPVVTEVRPEQGRHFIQVGFTWNTGVFTGMNDAGLVVCMERTPGLGMPDLKGAPLEMRLRELLQTAERPAQVVEQLLAQPNLRGFHVLVAGIEKTKSQAVLVACGGAPATRDPQDGLLLGADPAAPYLEDDAKIRYTRVAAMLAEERIIGPEDMQRVLADAELGRTDAASIWNAMTRHSVIFIPRTRTMLVAFRGPEGESGAYTAYSLEGGAADE